MVGQSIIPPDKLPDEVEITEEGARWEKDGLIYKADRIRKSDVLDYDVEWKRLFAIMGLLAEKFDDNNVRLVVWFGD